MSDSEKPESTPAAEPAKMEPTGADHPPAESGATSATSTEPHAGKPPALRQGDQGGGPAQRIRDLDAQIEGELQAALAGMGEQEIYGELTKEKPGRRRPQRSSQGKQKGKVVAVHGADIFVEVPGGRSQGVLPMAQFPEGGPAVGAEVEFQVESYDSANGLYLLSRRGAAVHADWSTVTQGMIVEVRVTSTNKGGLSVDVNGIRGFMPISQIDLYRVENAEQFVNQKMKCMIVEVNPSERNLVVSRRALLEKEREEARERIWQELAEGQVRDGVVRSIREFGAFVDLGGVDGLLHVSEMSWSRNVKPEDVMQTGQTIKVVILKIDREKHKISLGFKQLQPSPWEQIEGRYPLNHIVSGKVTRLAEFGAFVELEPGIEGLIHISELSPQRVRRVGDVVQQGQQIQVLVLRIDTEQRKISLSLKGALPKEEYAVEEETPAAATKPTRHRTTPLRGGIGE